jgi:hypothetical protein
LAGEFGFGSSSRDYLTKRKLFFETNLFLG